MFNQVVSTSVVACSLQVWVLGQSPEFGHCKATKKARFSSMYSAMPCWMAVHAMGAYMGCHCNSCLCMPIMFVRRHADACAMPHCENKMSGLASFVLQNGEPCRMPVNAARCPFCPYHVQASMGVTRVVMFGAG